MTNLDMVVFFGKLLVLWTLIYCGLSLYKNMVKARVQERFNRETDKYFNKEQL